MELKNVSIKNFKGIEEKNITFKAGFNLIKGSNGMGKTSILEAIAVGLGGFIAGLPNVTTRHFSSDEVRNVYTRMGDGSYDRTYVMLVEVSMEAVLDGEEFKWTRGKSSINASRSITQPRDICRKAEKMAEDNSTEFPVLVYLSAGYQSLIWMAFDIAYRMAVLNPDKKEYIAESKGVVLIDEIDMHLHPRWQWNIVNALKTVFSNVQFIAATHSPILFAASNDLWLIDVEKEEVNYTESRCGYDANAVLEIFMGAKSQNPETEKLIHSIYVAIRNKEEARKKLIASVSEASDLLAL